MRARPLWRETLTASNVAPKADNGVRYPVIKSPMLDAAPKTENPRRWRDSKQLKTENLCNGMQRICVYCGSSPGFDPCYLAMAQRLGQVLVDQNYELVYGGAAVGLMGRVADTVLRAGGVVTGVIPKALVHKVAPRGLTALHGVDSMHERKTMMFNLADAFIALPGGFGTVEEAAELLTWAQLGLHTKPCGVINVAGYFDLLLAFLDHAVAQGFMQPAHRAMLLVAATPEELLLQMQAYTAPVVEKWVAPQK